MEVATLRGGGGWKGTSVLNYIRMVLSAGSSSLSFWQSGHEKIMFLLLLHHNFSGGLVGNFFFIIKYCIAISKHYAAGGIFLRECISQGAFGPLKADGKNAFFPYFFVKDCGSYNLISFYNFLEI